MIQNSAQGRMHLSVNAGEVKIKCLGNGVVRVPLALKGRWKHKEYGEVSFDDKDFSETLHNLSTGALGFPPYLTYGHLDEEPESTDSHRKRGNMFQAVEEGDVLFGDFMVPPDVYTSLDNGEFDYASGEFLRNYTSKVTGNNDGTALVRVALTNSPFIPFGDTSIQALSINPSGSNKNCPQTDQSFVFSLGIGENNKGNHNGNSQQQVQEQTQAQTTQTQIQGAGQPQAFNQADLLTTTSTPSTNIEERHMPDPNTSQNVVPTTPDLNAVVQSAVNQYTNTANNIPVVTTPVATQPVVTPVGAQRTVPVQNVVPQNTVPQTIPVQTSQVPVAVTQVPVVNTQTVPTQPATPAPAQVVATPTPVQQAPLSNQQVNTVPATAQATTLQNVNPQIAVTPVNVQQQQAPTQLVTPVVTNPQQPVNNQVVVPNATIGTNSGVPIAATQTSAASVTTPVAQVPVQQNVTPVVATQPVPNNQAVTTPAPTPTPVTPSNASIQQSVASTAINSPDNQSQVTNEAITGLSSQLQALKNQYEGTIANLTQQIASLTQELAGQKTVTQAYSQSVINAENQQLDEYLFSKGVTPAVIQKFSVFRQALAQPKQAIKLSVTGVNQQGQQVLQQVDTNLISEVASLLIANQEAKPVMYEQLGITSSNKVPGALDFSGIIARNKAAVENKAVA